MPIKWHRDASMESVDATPAIDIGYYLGTPLPSFLPSSFTSCLCIIFTYSYTMLGLRRIIYNVCLFDFTSSLLLLSLITNPEALRLPLDPSTNGW